MPLQLDYIHDPSDPTRKCLFFVDWFKAASHICDHLLSRPESHKWRLLNPAINDVIDVENPTKCFQYAKKIWRTEGESCRDLYSYYRNEIDLDALDAHQLQWHAVTRDGQYRICMGTSGIIFIINIFENAVITAFLGLSGDPRSVSTTYPTFEERQKKPLPRDSSVFTMYDSSEMRSGRPYRITRKQEEQKKRIHRMKQDEQIFRYIFMKSLRFVRSHKAENTTWVDTLENCDESLKGFSNRNGNDYWIMKEKLLEPSKWSYHDWMNFRRSRSAERRPG